MPDKKAICESFTIDKNVTELATVDDLWCFVTEMAAGS